LDILSVGQEIALLLWVPRSITLSQGPATRSYSQPFKFTLRSQIPFI